jgi:hypothetical protein
MIQGQLLAHARLVFTQRDDAPPHGRHMLADRQVDALDEDRVDLVGSKNQTGLALCRECRIVWGRMVAIGQIALANA